MIVRRNRFHGYNSLKRVYQTGKSVRGSSVSLKYGFRTPHKPYRVAVVVSKKVNKSAVVRNRIRRRIYEAVRLQGKNIMPGIDLVFTVYDSKVSGISFQELAKTIDDLLGKVGASGQFNP